MNSMQLAGILINIFVYPGVGTFFVGKWVQALLQLILFSFGMLLCYTMIGIVIGAPLAFFVWIWGIVTVAKAQSEPIAETV